MKKQTLSLLLGLGLCLLGNAFTAGIGFAAGTALVILPEIKFPWHSIFIGALACSAITAFAGESRLVLWGLLFAALITLSMLNPWRAGIFAVGAWLVLRFGASPEFYTAFFASVIYNVIFLFTFEENCATIEA